jgi:hypothetical protein
MVAPALLVCKHMRIMLTVLALLAVPSIVLAQAGTWPPPPQSVPSLGSPGAPPNPGSVPSLGSRGAPVSPGSVPSTGTPGGPVSPGSVPTLDSAGAPRDPGSVPSGGPQPATTPSVPSTTPGG